MEKAIIANDGTELAADYFENYEIKPNDLEVLGHDIDQLAASGLVDDGVLKGIRFVTYDSNHLYVFTRGVHASNERFKVEELPSTSTSGLRIFKIPHDGFIGREARDYKGAEAGLVYDEVETTAVGATRIPNQGVLYTPNEADMILDVARIAPLEAYNKIKKKNCNYKTDMVFHEAGHLEHRRLQNWRMGDPATETFPSEAQRRQFLSLVQDTKFLSSEVKALLIPYIDFGVISEMYAMFIDREGAKKFEPVSYVQRSTQQQSIMAPLSTYPVDKDSLEKFKESLEMGRSTGRGHFLGQLLVSILEDHFPDFVERKQFVRDCLDPKRQP